MQKDVASYLVTPGPRNRKNRKKKKIASSLLRVNPSHIPSVSYRTELRKILSFPEKDIGLAGLTLLNVTLFAKITTIKKPTKKDIG